MTICIQCHEDRRHCRCQWGPVTVGTEPSVTAGSDSMSSAWFGVGLWVALVVSGILIPSGMVVALVLMKPQGIELLIIAGLLYVIYDVGRVAVHHPWRRKTPNAKSSDRL